MCGLEYWKLLDSNGNLIRTESIRGHFPPMDCVVKVIEFETFQKIKDKLAVLESELNNYLKKDLYDKNSGILKNFT